MKPDIGSESPFLPTPRAFDDPVRGSPSEYRREVWCRKTRLHGVAIRRWNKFENMFIRFDRMYERDRRTEGRTDTARRAAKFDD